VHPRCRQAPVTTGADGYSRWLTAPVLRFCLRWNLRNQAVGAKHVPSLDCLALLSLTLHVSRCRRSDFASHSDTLDDWFGVPRAFCSRRSRTMQLSTTSRRVGRPFGSATLSRARATRVSCHSVTTWPEGDAGTGFSRHAVGASWPQPRGLCCASFWWTLAAAIFLRWNESCRGCRDPSRCPPC